MKFLKYLFFLILIFATGVLLYFATQDGRFEVTESHTIDAPAEVVFHFINDFKNWETFGRWMDEEGLTINYPETTTGVGASYSWTGGKNKKGAMQTLSVTPYERIEQKIVFNGSLEDEGHQVRWDLEPDQSGQKTLVSWSMQGELGLLNKILFFVNDTDFEKMVSELFAESLIRLERAVENELQAYSITVEGLSIHPGWFYISNSMTASTDEKETTVDVLQKRVQLFFSDNNLQPSGPFFALFTALEDEQSVLITVGVPTSDFVALPENSDFYSGYLEESAAVKAVLTGNTTHLAEVLAEMEAYMNKNNYIKKAGQGTLLVFVVSKTEESNPANRVTDIYIPIEHINDSQD